MIDDKRDANVHYCRYCCPNRFGISTSCKNCPVEDNLSPKDEIAFLNSFRPAKHFVRGD